MTHTSLLNIRQIRRRSILLILLLILALAMLIAGFMFVGVRHQDRVMLESGRAMVENTLEISLQRLREIALDYAVWSEACDALAHSPDIAWADENIGQWLVSGFGISGSLVLDQDGRVTYAYLEGQRQTLEQDVLGEQIPRLHERIRDSHGHEPRALSGYVQMNGEVYAAVAAPVVPTNWDEYSVPDWPPTTLLLLQRVLDNEALHAVARSLRLHDFAIVHHDHRTERLVAVPLWDNDGELLGLLRWQARTPGVALFRQAILPGMLGFAAIVGLFLLLLQRMLGTISALHERESALGLNRHALDSISQGVLISDAQQKITYVNDAFSRITGWQRADILGQTLHLLRGVHTSPAMEQEIQSAFDRGDAFAGEVLHYRSDGMPFWNELTITPVCDARNQLCQFISTHHDITERKRTEEALARRLRYEKSIAGLSNVLLTSRQEDPLPRALEHLLEAARVDRVYIFQNSLVEGAGLCASQTHEVCLPGVASELHNPLLQNIPYSEGLEGLRQQLVRGEIIYGIVKDFPPPAREILEAQGIVSILILPLFVGGHWSGFIGFDDVSQPRTWDVNDTRLLQTSAELIGVYMEQRQSQETLEKMNQMLEQRVEEEVQHRRQSEQAMLQQSRTAAMGEMVSAIAHHWRQPLGAIALQVEFLQQLCREAGIDDMDEVEAITRQVIARVQELSTTIDNLYGFSQRHEAARTVDIRGQVQIVIDMLRPQFRAHEIEIHFSCSEPQQGTRDVLASIYPAAFKQSIFNLMINARDAILVKRNRLEEESHRGGAEDRVDIFIDTSADHIRIVIEDSGTGIDESIVGRIFDPFFTTREVTRGEGLISGTGTGLYMAKLAIEGQMGGWISASNTDHGARFEVSLPRA